MIANETVDIHDGGVSGVMMGDMIEFGPDDTPRIVEKPGVAALSRTEAVKLLSLVYGFVPALEFPMQSRVEFSIHPMRRGWRNEHTICWEYSSIVQHAEQISRRWPNKFSHMIGDKVFEITSSDANRPLSEHKAKQIAEAFKRQEVFDEIRIEALE